MAGVLPEGVLLEDVLLEDVLPENVLPESVLQKTIVRAERDCMEFMSSWLGTLDDASASGYSFRTPPSVSILYTTYYAMLEHIWGNGWQ